MIKVYLTCSLIFMTAFLTQAQTQSDSLSKARAEILPSFKAMVAAANEHNSEKHLSFYAKVPTLLFVINDQEIKGWDALLKQQRKWWHNGKLDVKYKLIGKPDFRMFASGLVMVTFFLTSHRTLSGGHTSNSKFGISDLWQKRPEGWRIIYAHESMVIK
jgi:ketosteroid isomerase-like protein